MRSILIVLLLLIASIGCSGLAHAARSYDSCTGTITSLPAVISTPGTWCLEQSLATSANTGNAITITSDRVTLDCNDFTIDGAGAGVSTRATAVFAQDRLDITIRHCKVRGFYSGLVLYSPISGGGHVVEDNRLDANTSLGIRVEGDGSVVRRNDVLATGSAAGTDGNLFGILTNGSVDVLDNTISGLVATTGLNGSVTGIYSDFNGTTGSVSIARNRVRGMHSDGTGKSWGIYGYSLSSRAAIRENDLEGDSSANSVGISCSSSRYRAIYNVIDGFATYLSQCADSGHNDKRH